MVRASWNKYIKKHWNASSNKRVCHIADFICYEKIIVELKTVSEITEIHKCQVLNYLKAAGLQLGIIGNFAQQSLGTARVVNSYNLQYE